MIGYQEVFCHVVFDFKVNFTRKARFVAVGSKMAPPSLITYASVIVQIAFLIAGLNDLNVLSADLQNVYLSADCCEKIYFVRGPKFGSNQGCVFIIHKALYGLKSARAAWRALLSELIAVMGFKGTKADPDVYIHAQVKPDGFEYYEMILIYVDDKIGKLYIVKKESVGVLEHYLGANIEKFQLPDGRESWSMLSHQYVQNVVKIVEGLLAQEGVKHKGKAEHPYPWHYRPEGDVSQELEPYLV